MFTKLELPKYILAGSDTVSLYRYTPIVLHRISGINEKPAVTGL